VVFETVPFDHSGTPPQFDRQVFVVVGDPRGSGAAIYPSASILVHLFRTRTHHAIVPAAGGLMPPLGLPDRQGSAIKACDSGWVYR
jgi:hypothetical protein